jgi:two-component system cell cycle sensor histidine kinase/response regulator CckA
MMPDDRVKVLIIDDDPTDRAIFKSYLQANGADAFLFHEEDSGAGGLEACREFNPDCVLLDYSLPDTDGLSVLRRLGSGIATLQYPVVMLTAIGSERLAVEAMKLGLMDYLAKQPASMDHLSRTIENAMQRFRMEREIALQRQELEERNRELEVAQSDLLQEKEKYRRLTEAIPQLVWSASPGHLIHYANKRLLEYSGQSANSSWPFALLVEPQDAGRLQEAWSAAAATRGVLETEARLRRAGDGACRWHLIRAVPIFDSDGKVGKWFGTCTDIENQKQSEEAVRQQQKLESIGLLAGGIAHDFNNLLVGIMGGASFALNALSKEHPAFPMMEMILRSSERAAHLTQQLLAYAGKGQMFLEPVNISQLLEETCLLIKASISKSVELDLRIDRDVPTIEASPSQIQQLTMNLIINASEAVGESSGKVTATTFSREVEDVTGPSRECGYAISPGLFVGLEVKDTGCGMDQTTKARVFEPFFTTKFTGRGLGLAAAQGIVRALRGWIEVESAPGKGSTFRVMLPVTHAARPRAPEPQEQHVPPQRARILLIDDEELVCRTAQAILERAGYSVLTARDGSRGLDLLREKGNEIDLVLLDLNMPGKSGVDVLRELRLFDNTIPVAVASGYSEDEVVQRFGPNMISGFVQKPFTSSRLVKDVRTLLKPATATGTA